MKPHLFLAPSLRPDITKSQMLSLAVIFLTAFRPSLPARLPGKYQEKPSSAIIAPTSRRNRSKIIHGPEDNCLKSPMPRPIKVEPRAGKGKSCPGPGHLVL